LNKIDWELHGDAEDRVQATPLTQEQQIDILQHQHLTADSLEALTGGLTVEMTIEYLGLILTSEDTNRYKLTHNLQLLIAAVDLQGEENTITGANAIIWYRDVPTVVLSNLDDPAAKQAFDFFIHEWVFNLDGANQKKAQISWTQAQKARLVAYKKEAAMMTQLEQGRLDQPGDFTTDEMEQGGLDQLGDFKPAEMQEYVIKTLNQTPKRHSLDLLFSALVNQELPNKDQLLIAFVTGFNTKEQHTYKGNFWQLLENGIWLQAGNRRPFGSIKWAQVQGWANYDAIDRTLSDFANHLTSTLDENKPTVEPQHANHREKYRDTLMALVLNT